MEKVTTFVTVCKSSYENFSSKNNLHLEQVKSGPYVNSNGFYLANINAFQEWTNFLSNFRGISIKHLQHYLDWFSFQKLYYRDIEANYYNYEKDCQKILILIQPMYIVIHLVLTLHWFILTIILNSYNLGLSEK